MNKRRKEPPEGWEQVMVRAAIYIGAGLIVGFIITIILIKTGVFQ